MGARRQSLTEFLADHGFGEFGDAPLPQFPEYPPHNTQLQAALARGARPTDADLALCVDLLRHARQQHELGNYAEEQQLLAQAHRQFGQVGNTGLSDTQRRVLILLLLLAAAGVAWWAWRRSKRKRRLRIQPNDNPKLVELDIDEEEEDEDPDEDDE